MAGIKSLAKDTAIYGVSSIIGRFLNWCLVPLYTGLFTQAEYGVVTYVYSVVAMAMVILTYGMETGFFRFANHERWTDPMQVYSTSLISLASTSSIFVVAVALLLGPVSTAMECPDHQSYVMIMAITVAVDAFLAIPYSYLRYKKRPMRFATLRVINIGVNIGLNLVFLLLCPWLMRVCPAAVDWWYNPDYGIGYIFLANLIATLLNLLMMIPELRGFRYRFNWCLLRQMLVYSAPLLVLGAAGIMNQTIDKILFPVLCSDHADAMDQLGIYGANYKIGIVMVMFVQAFRYAYEPFIFARNRQAEGRDRAYADAMKYFIIAAMVVFVGVMFFLPTVRYFISPRFFSGLRVVPIIMLAELCFGVFFNLSLWYKLTDKTIWGMWLSLMGLAVTVLLNVLLVPRIGYMGCAWAALASYGTMMVVSYLVGRSKNPIHYPLARIGEYVLVAAAIFALGMLTTTDRLIIDYPWRTILISSYIIYVCAREHIDPRRTLAQMLHRR